MSKLCGNCKMKKQETFPISIEKIANNYYSAVGAEKHKK
jgi:hypothetical protein